MADRANNTNDWLNLKSSVVKKDNWSIFSESWVFKACFNGIYSYHGGQFYWWRAGQEWLTLPE
jgi:hypothetical protein